MQALVKSIPDFTRLTSPLPDFDPENIGNIAEILDLAVEDPGTRGNCYRRMRVWERDGVLDDFP